MGKSKRRKQAAAKNAQRARGRAAQDASRPDYAPRGAIFAGRTVYTRDVLRRAAKLSIGENAGKTFAVFAAAPGLFGLQLVQIAKSLPGILLSLAALVTCIVLFAWTTIAPALAASLQSRRLDKAAGRASASSRDYRFYVTKRAIGIVTPDGERVERPLGDFASYATDDVLYVLAPRTAGGPTSTRHILSWGLDPKRGVVVLALDEMEYGAPADLAAFVRESVERDS